MENETVLQEILTAFKLHGEHIDKKMDNMKNGLELKIDNLDSRVNNLESKVSELDSKVNNLDSKVSELDSKVNNLDSKVSKLDSKVNNIDFNVNKLESKVDKGFDHLGKKIDGNQEDLMDLKETTNFLLSKVAKHEKKLQKLSE